MENISYHQERVETLYEHFATGDKGLSSEDAARKLHEFGPNELKAGKKKTPFMMFLDQFKDFMILILIAAAVVAGIIGELTDTLIIIVIVIANAVIGFVQEYRAEKAIEALKRMAAPMANVMRDGRADSIPSALIVPGDIVLLEAGAIVPADLRLVESAQLKVDEAALTGESVPVEKSLRELSDPGLPIGDRVNMAYKGTVVTYGRGSGVVVGTGMNTELGKIASMLQNEEEVRTPLQKRLTVFGKNLAIAILIICAIVFVIGLMRGERPLLMLLTAISLAVAAIPEALPAVITISLALGAKKMVKKNALIRKLPAVETLGSVTYICSDKTGTLTYNRMTVEELYAEGEIVQITDARARGLSVLMTGIALNNDSREGSSGSFIGDPTEVALYTAARDTGYQRDRMEEDFPRVGEIPFDSERKSMTTIHRHRDGGFISFTKGAPDVLVEKSDTILINGKPEPLGKDDILAANEDMAKRGLRVLCVAMRQWDTVPEGYPVETVEAHLTVLGLVGMMDPPRDEAKKAVDLCRTAGIKPVMITGDHPVTAAAIAKRIGILDEDGAVINGKELASLSDEEFASRVEHIQAYARVAPEQKLKIVKALQQRHQFVAMTGDGVNDAPALKRADIGIAMGITGTDVSKEAAHMILLDDNFSTIVQAVQEGRKIYDNIRKFIRYLLSTNTGEIMTIFFAQILGFPIPLLPIHILWVNLVTDSLPALALSVEPAEDDVMQRPPRNPKDSIFSGGLGIQTIWVGSFMALLVLSVQFFALRTANGEWQTMVFTVLCFTQLANALAIRSDKKSLFRQGLLSNKTLLGAVVVSIAMQLAVIYVRPLNAVFRTQPLTLGELALCVGISSLVFFAVETEKLIRRVAAGRKKRES
ncbi:MAG: calcium-translocating P-type ATPase, PMCA-type [Syntrophorhabdaceae bacterium]|nr:calcium-translocating P-type ATPase, PMCA-type [Syntrophorhabdaceae bacterium]